MKVSIKNIIGSLIRIECFKARLLNFVVTRVRSINVANYGSKHDQI